jgi:hypothetical protein
LTFDAGSATLYVDGAERSITATAHIGVPAPAVNDNGSKITVGARPSGGAESDLRCYDVRIFNDALTTNEITYLYTDGQSGTDPGEANLLGHYWMQEESNSYAYDSSGNSNDSLITNFLSSMHVVDSAVRYSPANEVGLSTIWRATNQSTDIKQVLTANECAPKTSSTITFNIQIDPTDTAGIIFANNSSLPPLLGAFQSGSTSAIYNGTGTPTVKVDTVTVANRGAFYTAISDGNWHAVEITNADLSGFTNGLHFSGWTISTYYFKGFISDLIIDDVEINTNATFALPKTGSTTNNIFDEAMFKTGKVPMYGLAKYPSWNLDGSTTYIDLGENPIPDAGNWSSIIIYFKTSGSIETIFDQRDANDDGISLVINSGNKLQLSIDSTDYQTLSNYNDGEWHKVEITDTAMILDDGAETVSITQAAISVTTPMRIGARSHTSPDQYWSGELGTFTFVVGGVTSIYVPLSGTRDVAKVTSDGVDTKSITNAIQNGTLGSLFGTGNGYWRVPQILNGARWNGTSLLPLDDLGNSPDGNAENVVSGVLDRYDTITIDRTGGVLSPIDYELGLDTLTAEAGDDDVSGVTGDW